MIAILAALAAFGATPAPAKPAPPPPSDPPSSVEADYFRQAVMGHEAELLAVVQKQDPGQYQRLLQLKTIDNDAYVGALFKVSKMVERSRDDPAFADRMRQIQDKDAQLHFLAQGFAQLTPTEQAARRAQLVKLAGELMDLKQAERRARLADLQQRLDDLQKEIDQREQQRGATVDKYVDQLVKDQIDL